MSARNELTEGAFPSNDEQPGGAAAFDLARVSPADALKRHLDEGFGEHENADVNAFQFDAYHRLAEAVPHFDLTVPDDKAQLDAIVASIANRFEDR